MKLLGEVKQKEEDCPSTTLCIKTCKHDLKLGPKGSDGCPSCACIKSGKTVITSAKSLGYTQNVSKRNYFNIGLVLRGKHNIFPRTGIV
jgi:hypothetical protein